MVVRATLSAMTEGPTEQPRPSPGKDHEAARVFALEAARSLADDKCTDVLVLDLRGKSQVTDFFVIGSGSSERQMRSSAFDVAKMAKERGFHLYRTNMDEPAQSWIVLDFVDLVVHVFDPATRAYYDLEMLWGDSDRIDWSRPNNDAAPARRNGATTRDS